MAIALPSAGQIDGGENLQASRDIATDQELTTTNIILEITRFNAERKRRLPGSPKLLIISRQFEKVWSRDIFKVSCGGNPGLMPSENAREGVYGSLSSGNGYIFVISG